MIHNRLRRALGTLLAASLVLPLTGCWSKMEINNRTFITGLFVDAAETPGEVELTVLAPLPNRLGVTGGPTESSASKGQPFASVTKTAPTLQEAYQKIQSDLTRKLTWGQTRVIVVGRRYAENGLRELLEWGMRLPSFPFKCFLFVAPDQAKRVISLTPVFEQTPSEVLREFANRHTLLNTSFKNILIAATAKQGWVATLLTLGAAPMVSENNRMSVWAGTDGAALFRNNRLAGTLDHREGLAVSWAKGALESPTYVSKDEKGSIALTLQHLKSQSRPFVRGDDVVFRIRMSAEASLDEVVGTDRLNTPGDYHRLENRIAADAASDLRSALRKSQSAQADILQAGSLLEWRYPRAWDRLKGRWEEAYRKDVRFDISVKVRIMQFNDETKSLFTTE
jgi:spore germination protein KC